MGLPADVVVCPCAAIASRLRATDVLVCVDDLRRDAESALPYLSPAERTRFHSYRNRIVARRFAIGRLSLRSVLGQLTGCPPDEVAITLGPHGKPELAEQSPDGPLWFSVSHSDDLVVIAVSGLCAVGVDVERVRHFRSWEGIAKRVLTTSEHAELMAAVDGGEDPRRAFLTHWCRVEAALKATGLGMQGLEQHRLLERDAVLRLLDFPRLPLPLTFTDGSEYQGAVATWRGDSSRAASAKATALQAVPTTTPASASTP